LAPPQEILPKNITQKHLSLSRWPTFSIFKKYSIQQKKVEIVDKSVAI